MGSGAQLPQRKFSDSAKTEVIFLTPTVAGSSAFFVAFLYSLPFISAFVTRAVAPVCRATPSRRPPLHLRRLALPLSARHEAEMRLQPSQNLKKAIFILLYNERDPSHQMRI